jgi:hypothetical protein
MAAGNGMALSLSDLDENVLRVKILPNIREIPDLVSLLCTCRLIRRLVLELEVWKGDLPPSLDGLSLDVGGCERPTVFLVPATGDQGGQDKIFEPDRGGSIGLGLCCT